MRHNTPSAGFVRTTHRIPARIACAAGIALALGIASGVAPLASVAWAEDSMPGSSPDGGGSSTDTQSFDYSGSYAGTITADDSEETVDGQSVDATDSSANAILAENGGSVTVTSSTVTKSGDGTDDDDCNFYGVNSILLSVGEGSIAYVSGSSLSATSAGSNGLFATDEATIYANDISIDTTEDNSRGLDATYGGTVIANDVEITTEGDHSAGAANDRGGGYVSVTNSTITTAGSGSPILYSTGAVEADNITGTATGSQLAGMEGLNTIRIANSTLESSITEATASDPVANGVIIYQSTSGDADTSTGERALFEVRDSSLSSAIESGSMFYLTNTSADIVLSNSALSFDSDAANLITVEGNDSNNWGTAGSNGADVTLTARQQVLTGTISVDTISSLDVYLMDDSLYTGSTEITENSVASTSDAPISITVESGSTWVVTADSTVSNLSVDDDAQIIDETGSTVSIVVDGETVVEGASDLTVTVEGTYSTDVDTSDAVELTDAIVDRTEFDNYYGTSTTFGTNGVSSTSDEDSDSDDSDTSDADNDDSDSDGDSNDSENSGIIAWLSNLWDSFLSLFS